MAALSPDAILLTGRVAVVTGAARGIGRAIAETFEAFGAQVAICDRDKPRLDRSNRDKSDSPREARPDSAALAMTLDVRDPVAVGVFTRAVAERWGRVDVLVNNAGQPRHAPFAELSARDERTLIEGNFTQVTGMIRSMLPLMGQGASIINVTVGEAPGFAVYAAMKAAVESLTRSLALELAPRGIRVNAIATGELPLGDPDDVAGAAVFLAGDLARSVTGATVHVDGGRRA